MVVTKHADRHTELTDISLQLLSSERAKIVAQNIHE